MNRSRDQKHPSLPRINSQPRVHTSNSHYQMQLRKQTLGGDTVTNTNRVTSKGNFTTMRRTLSSAKVSKAFKNQTTGLIYAKKIQDLERQNYLINNQIKLVKQQIQTLRQSQMHKKRNEEFLDLDDQKSQVSGITVGNTISLRKNISANNPTALKNQIKVTENKIDTYRKKIDKQSDKNNAFKKQIDAFRKQISTIKSLSTQLKQLYAKTCDKYQQQCALSKKLDQLIAQKNNLLHKRKVQSLHQKAKMIKQYDNILKSLDKQLQADKMNKIKQQEDSIGKNNFYVTQIGIAQKQQNSAQLISPNKKKINYSKQINNAKTQLQSYEQQFRVVKQHTGFSNADKITQQFLNKYQQNFEHYKYIQQLYSAMEQLRVQKQQLETRKAQILSQIHNRNTETKEKGIFEMKVKINGIKNQKQSCKNSIKKYQETYSKIKQFILAFFQKISYKGKMPAQGLQNLDQSSVLLALSIVQQRQNQLQQYNSQIRQNRRTSSNASQNVDLEQIIDSAKKQGQNMRNDKLYGRQDFIKMREATINMKKTKNIQVKKEKSRIPKKDD